MLVRVVVVVMVNGSCCILCWIQVVTGGGSKTTIMAAEMAGMTEIKKVATVLGVVVVRMSDHHHAAGCFGDSDGDETMEHDVVVVDNGLAFDWAPL